MLVSTSVTVGNSVLEGIPEGLYIMIRDGRPTGRDHQQPVLLH